MELQDLQQNWTAFGEQDPLWAILAFPDKQGGAWDLEEFFATGQADVDDVLRELTNRGIAVDRGRALDFGCGVGRLTKALAESFDSCDGVDVAGSMIDRARELNNDHERLRFHHNKAPDLRLFGAGSFDFILSLIVLQHMTPELMRGYLSEFVRVLRPGGIAYFQIPERVILNEPLPPEAWRASLTLIGTVPPFVAGRVASLRVRVRNDSPVPWPAVAQVRLGNHWRSPDGRMVLLDDARTAIESTVGPGEEREMQLTVRGPSEPGDYELEIDLVQEGISWFADGGSSTVSQPVTVAAPIGGPAHEDATTKGRHADQSAPGGFTPRMEMHALAREDVLATVEEAGGVVLDVVAKDRSGPSMPSLDYVVARALTPERVRSGFEPDSPQAAVEARIRRVLGNTGCASRARAERLPAGDPQASERRARPLRLLDERADLVGFGLTSTLRGVGHISSGIREVLSRAMFQVLYRQTEHNRASGELIRGHTSQLEALGAEVGAQLDLQAATEERLAALEGRLDLVEVNSVTLARRAARAGTADIDFSRE